MHVDKRETIMDAAVELFAVKGFEGSSIREIAQAAGVNLAMINYYFGTKEKLFEQLVLHRATNILSATGEIINNTQLSYQEKMEQLLYAHVERLFHHRHFHRVIHQEMMLSNRTQLQEIIVNSLSPNNILIQDLINEGIAKGAFKPVDTHLIVATFFGTVNYVVSSRKFCNKLLNKEDDYIPYEDESFKQRMKEHLKDMLLAILVK